MPRKPAAERRVEIVEAALRVIARDGIHNATVRAIAAEADMPLATFHYVFDSRDEMIGEAYGHIVRFIDPAPLEALPAGATLDQAVRALLDAWFANLLEHPEWVLASVETMAYCCRTPALAHVHQEVQARLLGAAAALIEALAERMGIAPATPAREVATLAVHLADGIGYSWLRTRDAEASRRMLDVAVPVLVGAIGGPGAAAAAGPAGADRGLGRP
ncbi:TetR family transcriptional regulator [Agrococcus sp. SL85]|uniref:TetR/AcrR family transcriptional regulator n=1 Tax=Agrococcus sp. SL85 TaxID=2995141 RepID=UPI00226D38A3|nr:TetR family transcriptional regulator [Agrococcus sp. SL85]WAC65327.1 TetR family transcriptional regulator [Agrococcus sp. SL85]